MMEIIFVVVVVILAIIVVKWYISTQRELVNLDEKCNNALSQIEVQLNSRWDALLALAKATQSYAKHEGEVLVNTISARRTTEVKTAADVNAQQDAYSEMLGRLMAVNEAYPELKASGLYAKTMNSIDEYEEDVRMARIIYNDTATRMNKYVRQWPTSFVAGQLRFQVKEYLKIDSKEKKAMPDMFTE